MNVGTSVGVYVGFTVYRDHYRDLLLHAPLCSSKLRDTCGDPQTFNPRKPRAQKAPKDATTNLTLV